MCNQLDHCIDVSFRLSVSQSVHQHFTGSTLCGPDLRIFLSFTLDNDFYRQLWCRRFASNLLFWPWHFSDLSKRSRKTLIFQLNTFHGCLFVGTRSQKPFTLDNDFYRQLRCRRCASNLLFWPWHFFDLSKRSKKTFIFQLNNLDGCHFVGTISETVCHSFNSVIFQMSNMDHIYPLFSSQKSILW